MALTPIDEIHALQIQAGILGRKAGHEFEDKIALEINALRYPLDLNGPLPAGHVHTGDPAHLLLRYLCRTLGYTRITRAVAISTGALATSEEGQKWLSVNGVNVRRCKSDLVVTLAATNQDLRTVGISTKQCNNPKPTNAQLYFTTARGFAALLERGGIAVSCSAVNALRQFCGDVGFRPIDDPAVARNRVVDPRRYFWEEIDKAGRAEWERVLSLRQDEVSRLLFQKAYFDDPFTPDFLLHKTKRAPAWSSTEVAIYSIDELIVASRNYQGFTTKAYSVNKGTFPDPRGTLHLAPRFGVIQMQRGGQAQHPEQLQFNLEASYFYKIT